MSDALIRILRPLGSHTVTLVLICALGVVVFGGIIEVLVISEWVILPLAALFLNLMAALIAHGTLRSQSMLFAFHALMGVLVLLIAADDLTALRGHVEVTEGSMFDPGIANVEAGPLHPTSLDEIAFVQGPFEIHYLPRMKRRETYSNIRIPAADGTWTEAVVGDDDPLIVGRYRLYTSFNKGFAPVITYTGPDGRPVTGAVHMPSYPLNDYQQGNSWTPPGGEPVMLWLEIPEPVYDADNEWVFRKPKDPVLVVISDETRQELHLGMTATLPQGGTVRFDTLRSWMGYTIASNMFNPWMLAVAIAACLALFVHIWEKLQPVPGAREELGEAHRAG